MKYKKYSCYKCENHVKNTYKPALNCSRGDMHLKENKIRFSKKKEEGGETALC